MPELTKCPKCGCDRYLMRQVFSGTGTHYARFDGEEDDNEDLHAYLRVRDLWKYPRCANCGYKLKELHPNNAGSK